MKGPRTVEPRAPAEPHAAVPKAAVPKAAAPSPPAGLAEAVGADVETTLYGDLPEDFWGEQHDSPVQLDDTAPSRAGAKAEVSAAPGDPAASSPSDPDALDGAVQLFSPRRSGGEPHTPTGARASTEPPPEPEGERFGQLQALFPGRIIEVTRRERGAADEAAAIDESGAAQSREFDGTDDYAGAAIDESVDEPRYDTAAEAAADTDSEAADASAAKESR